jgi:hypothetical protein
MFGRYYLMDNLYLPGDQVTTSPYGYSAESEYIMGGDNPGVVHLMRLNINHPVHVKQTLGGVYYSARELLPYG